MKGYKPITKCLKRLSTSFCVLVAGEKIFNLESNRTRVSINSGVRLLHLSCEFLPPPPPFPGTNLAQGELLGMDMDMAAPRVVDSKSLAETGVTLKRKVRLDMLMMMWYKLINCT